MNSAPETRTTSLIEEFFKQRRFAMIGVSRNSADFSRALFREFLQRDLDVVPVNPNTTEIEGRASYKSIKELDPPVTGALIMTSERTVLPVLEDCVEAGITLVWIYGIVGPSKIAPFILKFCDAHSIRLIPGYCPLMFLPGAETFHRFHRWAWKLIGYYPD